jgi:glycosyltransferase involved in cell wall biosynthesis
LRTGTSTAAPEARSVALVTSIAHSLPNFRGPLIAALAASGLRVFALAPDYDELTRERVRALGAEPVDYSLERAGIRPLRDLADAVRLWRLLRRLRPDAVLCYFAKPVIYGSLAAWLARIPRRIAMIEGLGYVFTESEGSDSFRRRALRGATRFLYRLALATVARAVFVNRDDAAQFVRSRLVAERKVVNIGGIGVDLDAFSAAPPVIAPPTFLLLCRLLREKGIREYAEAARLVKARCPEARFVLAGSLDPNPGAMAREQIEAWVEEGLLEWPGHIDDVRPWLRAASVYVLPSYREGVPRSTQEAMAMARPIVTTDSIGCRDTVEEGVNGFMVPARTVGPLAGAMMRFIDEPGLIETMGRESRRLAEARFDVNRTNRLLIDLLLPSGPPRLPLGEEPDALAGR